MKKIGIFYGSSTGTCEGFANQIAEQLSDFAPEVMDVTMMTTEMVESYDVLILGTSTWGLGELQDDWYDGVKALTAANLNGKTVALFGCGDACSYSDTFCDGMGLIYQEIETSGCTFIGQTSADGYSHSSSISDIDGTFVGLPLDDINDSNNDERIAAWIADIKTKL